MSTFDIIIYHNKNCSSSRNVVDIVRQSGFEPHIIEYLKTPPTAKMLLLLAKRANVSIRDLLRNKEKTYEKLNLSDGNLSDNDIAQSMHQNPELINRPIVVSSQGVSLCRPVDKVLELLVLPQ